MPKQVCMGALLTCTFGAAPSSLVVLPKNRVMSSMMPAANIMDNLPIVNIVPFGACTSPNNPAVIAALGSPMPCVPMIPAPWSPGSPTVLIANIPALNSTSKLMCAWAGMIAVSMPGQLTHDIA